MRGGVLDGRGVGLAGADICSLGQRPQRASGALPASATQGARRGQLCQGTVEEPVQLWSSIGRRNTPLCPAVRPAGQSRTRSHLRAGRRARGAAPNGCGPSPAVQSRLGGPSNEPVTRWHWHRTSTLPPVIMHLSPGCGLKRARGCCFDFAASPDCAVRIGVSCYRMFKSRAWHLFISISQKQHFSNRRYSSKI